MIFSPLAILPGEHYISWFIRQSQYRAYPELNLFLANNDINYSSLKSYDVLHMSVLGFLKHNFRGKQYVDDHTLIPLWQFSLGRSLSTDELVESDFLELYECVDDKTTFQFDRSWHSCPTCREEDLDNFGSSYWHVAHQMPTVFKCFKHNVFLERSDKPIADLRKGQLPHQISKWEPFTLIDSESINRWQMFVFKMHEQIVINPEKLVGIKKSIQSVIGIDNSSKEQALERTNEFTPKLEADVGKELLSYLFKDYARPSNKGEPKILMGLFSRIYNPYKLRSPVFWLLLAYWLKYDDLISE